MIDDIFETAELPKGYELQVEGTKSNKFFYFENGSMQLYFLKDGKDITHLFLRESSIYTPIENVFFNEYYPYNWKTASLEALILLCLKNMPTQIRSFSAYHAF